MLATKVSTNKSFHTSVGETVTQTIQNKLRINTKKTLEIQQNTHKTAAIVEEDGEATIRKGHARVKGNHVLARG
jgi:hypothetical protein